MLSIKEINRLAIPAILYNVIDPVIGLVDTAVLGLMDDATVAQAGVGLAAGFYATLVWGLAQIRTAVGSLVSQYLGKNQLDKIKSLVPQAMHFNLLIGVVFAALTMFFFLPISDFIYANDSAATVSNANEYFQIRAWGLPLSLLIAGFYGVFRGLQNTSNVMYAALAGGILNVVLDLMLVNGFYFIPAMGVKGVALASAISQLLIVIICIYYYIKQTPFSLVPRLKLNPEFGKMLGIAGNMLLRTIALNGCFLLALRFAGQYGNATLAAYNIGIQIWLFSSFFIDGYSHAGNAMAGKFLGAKDPIMLKELVTKLLKINCTIAIGLGIVYLCLYPFLGSFFNDDPAVISSLQSFFWIVIVAQPLNSMAFTMDGILKGMGDAKLLRNTLFIATFLIFVPTLFLGDHFGMSIYAVWLAFVLWMLYRGGSLVFIFYKKRLQQL